ncbi:H2.0-like homeobox protein [Bagarius yarrelli]|uniref:H2.0-like homeobox protein n=1 Tax=Bagarius yarrelli TaxID=175774 RepID=A0A556TZK1_BAGYA|nr:H2.0-like homeobox protein [Bagarius yarrelli]
MYTAGLNPLYASNFSLWSAYCSGGFAMDTGKKPSFCIADILHFGDNDNVAGSSALVSHIGARAQVHSTASPLRPSPLTPDAAVFGGRVNAASAYHRHGIHLTSVARTTFFTQSVPPLSSKDLKFGIDRILSTEFEPKSKESSALRDHTSVISSNRQSVSVQPNASQYFVSIEPGMGDASSIISSSRQSGHQYQDTFPGPYAVLTKDTMPQTYKRKRSWSRAVFSNLQRKGLEKRFEIQKYVKVWFQNRRMKWRHSKEAQAQKDKEKEPSDKPETEQKAHDESECETEQSDSEFEEDGTEPRRDSNISESSVIITGPMSTDIEPTTNPVTDPTAPSQIPF